MKERMSKRTNELKIASVGRYMQGQGSGATPAMSDQAVLAIVVHVNCHTGTLQVDVQGIRGLRS